MNWFLIALLPPIFWGMSNHIDKYLLSKYFVNAGAGALLIFSSIFGLFLLPIIAIIHPPVFTTFEPSYLLISLSGMLIILSLLPYFYALQQDDVSTAVPLFQMIPIFSYFLSYLVLGETLTAIQIIGGVVILIGALLISFDLTTHKKFVFKGRFFLLMVASSFLWALNTLLFKFFAINSHFWIISFWEYVGFAVFSFMLLIFVKPYRLEFFRVMRGNKLSVLSINGMNELFAALAKTFLNFASLLAPLTLVWIVSGLQPLIVFLIGIVLTVFFPKISKENISRQALSQKAFAIVIIFVGAVLINLK